MHGMMEERWEHEIGEERRRCDAECSGERRRYEAESERRISEMAKQIEFLHKLVTERELRETPTGTPTLSNSSDDIEAYLTTFERMMKAYEVAASSLVQVWGACTLYATQASSAVGCGNQPQDIFVSSANHSSSCQTLSGFLKTVHHHLKSNAKCT